MSVSFRCTPRGVQMVTQEIDESRVAPDTGRCLLSLLSAVVKLAKEIVV